MIFANGSAVNPIARYPYIRRMSCTSLSSRLRLNHQGVIEPTNIRLQTAVMGDRRAAYPNLISDDVWQPHQKGRGGDGTADRPLQQNTELH